MPYCRNKSFIFINTAWTGNLEEVKRGSLDPEVYLNTRDPYGHTPFFWPCRDGHVKVVRYLLDFQHPIKTVKYNVKNCDGWSPFFAACENGQAKVVEMLLADERIEVETENQLQQTPLWIASQEGHLEVVKLLLASNRPIDVMKRDAKGRTAAEIARERGEEEIASLLESFESDQQKARAESQGMKLTPLFPF